MDAMTEAKSALEACLASMERFDFSEGVCMCGDSIESHGFGSGHSPVDAGGYYAGQAVVAARKWISKWTP